MKLIKIYFRVAKVKLYSPSYFSAQPKNSILKKKLAKDDLLNQIYLPIRLDLGSAGPRHGSLDNYSVNVFC
tara:strand:- start:2765 stop:2977 length:213 start_codon:yes stop_codon:yes gene_type:complete